jgi:hypothetical protein
VPNSSPRGGTTTIWQSSCQMISPGVLDFKGRIGERHFCMISQRRQAKRTWSLADILNQVSG